MLKSWKRRTWHGFQKGVLRVKTRLMFKQKVQPNWRRREGLRDDIQIWGLHQIIKIICHCIIHMLYKCHICLYHGVHPIICLVTPHILILTLGSIWVFISWRVVTKLLCILINCNHIAINFKSRSTYEILMIQFSHSYFFIIILVIYTLMDGLYMADIFIIDLSNMYSPWMFWSSC